MAKITWKGSALLAPVPPVMVTCGDMEKSNIITVGWTGIINTHPPRVSIAVRPTRHSYQIIKDSGEFIIHLTPASLIRECDYCGIYTGAKVDKFAKTGLHKASASVVACPIIEECPLALECRVIDILPQGTHDLFLAEVVAVDVEDSILDEMGSSAWIAQGWPLTLTGSILPWARSSEPSAFPRRRIRNERERHPPKKRVLRLKEAPKQGNSTWMSMDQVF